MEHSIYTYCYKRIDEVGGGWGFYSYSDGMKDLFYKVNELKDYASGHGYEIPQNSDVWLVPQLTNINEDVEKERIAIEQYHPEKFAYKRIKENGNDLAVFTYGRNLGREIIAEESRTSNKVVYTVAGKMSEIVTYPCSYCKNDIFKKLTRKNFKDCCNMETSAKPLNSVTMRADPKMRDKVIEFIKAEEEREEVLVKLFYSLINEQSGSGRPVLICDRKENIIFWISAVTMLFPYEIARNIFFSTYDFLGDSIGNIKYPSDYHICGVYSPSVNDAPESGEQATNYLIDDILEAQEVVVFDFECWVVPDVETDEFQSVIHEFCQGNFEPLDNYHRYLLENTTYRGFDSLYTKFYPYSEYKDYLYKYYSSEKKLEIYNEVSPDIYDSGTSDERFRSSLSIVMEALNSDIISKTDIRPDIHEYICRIVNDQHEDLNFAERIDPLVNLIFENDFNDQVRETFLRDYKNCIDTWDFTVNKVTDKYKDLILRFSVDDKTERYELNKMFINISANPNGSFIISQIIYKWLESFDQKSPELSPERIKNLYEVVIDKVIYMDNIVNFFYDKWDKEYRKKVLEHFYNTDLFDELIEKLLNASYRKDTMPDDIFFILNFLMKNKSVYEEEWHTALTASFRKNASFSKKILDKLFENSRFTLRSVYTDVISSVYRGFNFYSAEDLAEFSYKHLSLIKNPGEYQVDWIGDAVVRCQFDKKDWKKAVKKVLSENDEDNPDLKNGLSDFVLQYIEMLQSSDESDNKNIFSKFFKKE